MKKSTDYCLECDMYKLGVDRGANPEPILEPESNRWYWIFPKYQDDPNFGFSPICRLHQSEYIQKFENQVKNPPPPPDLPSRFKRISEIIRWIRDGEFVRDKLQEALDWLQNIFNSIPPFRKSVGQN